MSKFNMDNSVKAVCSHAKTVDDVKRSLLFAKEWEFVPAHQYKELVKRVCRFHPAFKESKGDFVIRSVNPRGDYSTLKCYTIVDIAMARLICQGKTDFPFLEESEPNNYSYSPTGLWFSDKTRIIKLKDRKIAFITHSSLDC